MGSVFEGMIRKFAEANNGDRWKALHPREVIALMVDLLLVGDEDATTPVQDGEPPRLTRCRDRRDAVDDGRTPGKIRTLPCAC